MLLDPFPCHKLSYLPGPLSPSSVTYMYFMDGIHIPLYGHGRRSLPKCRGSKKQIFILLTLGKLYYKWQKNSFTVVVVDNGFYDVFAVKFHMKIMMDTAGNDMV